jgi:hypothetical protein
MNKSVLYSFSLELQKQAGISSTTPSAPEAQEPKKKNIIQRNFTGPGVVLPAIGGLVAGAALLRNPSGAGKLFTAAKEVATKPVQSIKRGLSSGANFAGNNADEFTQGAARSKRVELMNEAFENALDGTATQFDALSDTAGAARKGGWASAGERSSGGLTGFFNKDPKFNASDNLRSKITSIMDRQRAGEMIPEEELLDAYRQIGQEAGAQNVKLRGGISTYMPGERAIEVGQVGVTGVANALPSTDDEGNERGVAERLARGLTAAGITAGTAHLFTGRNLGLGKSNLITGGKRSFLSQKLIVPSAVGMAAVPFEGLASDVTGSAGSVLDRAFGQGKDEQS